MISPVNSDYRQRMRLQFSLWKLFVVMTWAALFLALWRIPGEGVSLTSAFLCTTLAIFGYHLTRSKLIFVSGLAGFLLTSPPSQEEPFFAPALTGLWMMFAVWFASTGFKAVFCSPPREK